MRLSITTLVRLTKMVICAEMARLKNFVLVIINTKMDLQNTGAHSSITSFMVSVCYSRESICPNTQLFVVLTVDSTHGYSY